MEIQDFIKRRFSEVIVYPDSDGKPMADNTLQALWIIMLYNNLRGIVDLDEVFIAADHLWYPIEGDPKTRIAPDVMVVIGRPDGYRGSYKQWLEEDMAPQVVFEVLSPSSTEEEMLQKLNFYEKFGVEEFIILDPEKGGFEAYVRKEEKLVQHSIKRKEWTSPTLSVQFSIEKGKLLAKHKDGSPFKTFTELKNEKEGLKSENEKLKARLRELGEDV
ncbi:MAG: Uma2 family endonuclease [Bacteroidota bacterium]